MKYVVWKHHISEHFENGNIPLSAGAGAGGTVFTNYNKMLEYLKRDGRDWHVTELEVDESEIDFNFKNNYMATILVDKFSKSGFKKIKNK